MWPEVRAQRDYFEQFRQQETWFTHGQFKDHGALHQCRVLVLANLLASFYRISDTAREAISWASVTHDSQSNGSKDYRIHGNKAALWLDEANLPISAQAFPLTKFLCIAHVPDDSQSNGLPKEWSSSLNILKDSDALDRVRFSAGSQEELRVSFLRLTISEPVILPVARELFKRTGERQMTCDKAFDLVMKEASDMGIVK